MKTNDNPNVYTGNLLETGSSTFTFSNSKYERTRGLSPVVLLLKQNSLETEWRNTYIHDCTNSIPDKPHYATNTKQKNIKWMFIFLLMLSQL